MRLLFCFYFLMPFLVWAQDTTFYQDYPQQIASIGHSKQSARSGYWRFYRADGYLREAGYYRKGIKHGTWSFFNFEAHPRLTVRYKHGKLHGDWKCYTRGQPAQLEATLRWAKDGTCCEYKTYFPNKQVNLWLKWPKNKAIGLAKKYDEQGNLVFKIGIKKAFTNKQEAIFSSRFFFEPPKIKQLILPHGDYIAYYTNNTKEKPSIQTVAIKGQLQDGIKVGTWNHYHTNGQLEASYYYDRGHVTTPVEVFHLNGQLAYQIVIDSNNLEYKHLVFHENGMPKFVTYYTIPPPQTLPAIRNSITIDNLLPRHASFYATALVSSSIYSMIEHKTSDFIVSAIQSPYDLPLFGHLPAKTGNWKAYYPNGQLAFDLHFEQNLANNTWKFYYPSGKLGRISTYKNGAPQGHCKHYHPNGQLSQLIFYNNGRTSDTSKYYFPNGQLKQSVVYKNGYKQGLEQHYHPETGKLVKAINFVFSKKSGACKTYHTNGKLARLETYLSGERHGTYQVFYENGQLQEEGVYRFDKLNGNATTYYHSGKLKTAVKYENDRLVAEAKYYRTDGSLEKLEFYSDEFGKEFGKLQWTKYFDESEQLIQTIITPKE